MATITPEIYHENEERHGEYQYVTLKTIVDSFLRRMQDDDHILKNTKRNLIVDYAKEAISELNKEVRNEVIAMEITVPDSLYFALPHDYVDYVRVSVVALDETSNSLRLQPLDVNNTINTADGYLQDDVGFILFDEDGYILKADSQNTYNKPYKTYEFNSCNTTGNATLDTTKYSKHGEFKIDKRNGKIAFSSDLVDQEIVMEYISDGLSPDTYNEGKIEVSKFLVETIKNWIFFAGIEHKKHVRQSEKQRALLRYKTTLHKAKIDLSGFDLLAIGRAMRISSKNR